MTKKKLTVLPIIGLAIALLFALIGVRASAFSAHADEGVTTVREGFTYSDDAKTELAGFELPEGVTGNYTVEIPAKVTSIGAHAFEDCENLTGVVLNRGLATIGDYAFTGTDLMELNVPNTVTTVGEHAFNGCALTQVTFEEGRTERLNIRVYAFTRCTGLRTLSLPDNTSVSQFAFAGCTGLLWVYAGSDCSFTSTAGNDFEVSFFPTNTTLQIIFPNAEAYLAACAEGTAFGAAHGSASTYLVKVNCHIGEEEAPVVYERLHGYGFQVVKSEDGSWAPDTTFAALPAQAAHYAATVWYGDSALTNAVSVSDVDELLKTQSEIDLYCHATIAVPALPAEPVSWVQSDKISYDITSLSEVLTAMGCTETLSSEQLSALDFTVVFTDEEGNVAETPQTIGGNGVYSVSVSLKPEYGAWSQPLTSTVTVNVNTRGFNTVMIVLVVVGVLAVAVTVSTAIIRKKVQKRNRKKQLSQREVLDKFKSIGGETHLN